MGTGPNTYSILTHNHFRLGRLLLITLLLFLQSNNILSQSDSTVSKGNNSNLSNGKAESIRELMNRLMDENRIRISDKQNIDLQRQKVAQLRSLAKEAKDYINKGIDTGKIIYKLSEMERLYQVTSGKIVTGTKILYSLRNVSSSELLLHEILERVEYISKPLGTYQKAIDKRRNSIDSLLLDKELYFLPADTTLYYEYEKGYDKLLKELHPIDSSLNIVTLRIKQLSNRVNQLKANILLDISRAEAYRKDLSQSMLDKEMPLIFSGIDTEFALDDTISFSYFKAKHIVKFFFQNNRKIFLLIFLLFVLLGYYFSIISKRILSDKDKFGSYLTDQIVQHPLLTALFVILNASQFFFAYPPFAVQALIWTVLCLSLLVLHRRDPGIFEKNLWLYLLILFILVIIDNLFLEASIMEIWFLVFISITSIILALNFYRNKKHLYSEKFVVKWVLYTFIFLEAGALLAILFGRYNLCKTLYTSGYFAIISGIFLYWTHQFIIKALNIYSVSVNTVIENNIFLNLKSFNDKNPQWINGIFILGWVILLIRNFYFYSVLASGFTEFMLTERSIGKYTYSFQSIFIFVLIILLSGLISKLLSFITDNSRNTSGPINKKGGIGNWLLLIRLAIIVIGALLAFAAAGIPMSKLTIIIGSLGVGIGFGLQNIVSNLISGVILAFERPIEIGDQIEVAGKVGRIKEIGIRSSRMINMDGAEVIIPNGDLLSQHVINWTLSNNHRRVEVIVSVKYGSNLIKVKEILENVLNSNLRIERSPAPVVLLHLLNNSSVDFRLLFWSDINFWLDAKSEVILDVYKAFEENGIEIPFAQQDVYIKEIPNSKDTKQL